MCVARVPACADWSSLELLTILTGNITEKTCSAGSVVTATGGVPPYTYVWSTDAKSEDNNPVAAGLYSVTVDDSNHCNATTSFSVSQCMYTYTISLLI